MIKFAIIHASYCLPPDGYYESDGQVTMENAVALVDANLNKTLDLLREAGRCRADIAITNEDFNDIGRHIRSVHQPDFFKQLVLETEDRITAELCAISKEYGMLIAANEYESDGGKIYNTTKLIGRDGVILDKYRKVHIPPGERFLVQPGTRKPQVMKTDIGNIGFSTCYDNIFPEHCRILALDGADIIIHQTQGWGTGGKSSVQTGEAFMRVRAAENNVYFIVAKNVFGEGGMSCIVDNHGNIISSMNSSDDNVFITELEPDFDMCDLYNYDNYYAGIASTRARKLLMREPSIYSRLTEGDPVFRSPALKGSKLCDRIKRDSDISALEAMDFETKQKFYW